MVKPVIFVRPIFFQSIFLGVLLLSGCTHGPERNESLTKNFSKEEIREDLIEMVQLLKLNHPALYDFMNKQRFDSLVNAQIELVQDSLTLSQAFKILSPIITKIGCSHTSLRISRHAWKDPHGKIFPLKSRVVNNSIFITEQSDQDVKLKPGIQIVKINNHSIDDLIKGMNPFISTDGFNPTAKEAVMNLLFNDLVSIYEGFPASYTISCKLPESEETSLIRVRGITREPYGTDEVDIKTMLDLTVVPEKRLAILTVKSFEFYNKFEDFTGFLEKSFVSIKNSEIQNLVLDLRGNSGGDPKCSAKLLTYIAQKPFVYFERPVTAEYTLLTNSMAPSKRKFSGNLLVLIDGLCLSSTGHFCALLKYHGLGKFIGSDTGGTYTCNDNSKFFDLKNTRLSARIATTTYQVPSSGLLRFKGIVPDYYSTPTVKDIIESNDRVLKTAVELIEHPIK